MTKAKNDSFQKYYDILNPEQKKVVDTIDGPLLVLAGPGTGKTQLLSVRAANILLKKKIDPDSILILTFTNAAARAMRDRLAKIVGHEGYSVEVETFHSFANSVVLESEYSIKYVGEKIDITDVEKIKALEYILDNVKGVEPLKPFGAPYIHLGEIQKRISELKNEGISPDALEKNIKALSPDGINLEEKHLSRLKALAIIYDKYEKLKNEECSILFDERGRKDFDDMILIAIDALKKEENLRRYFEEKYKYIMVDEYQDTNGAQLELIFSILDKEKQNLCCVGDDDQSIYRFQGATLTNFRILEERTDSLKTVVLKNNYRSSDKIINISSQIIGQIPEKERVKTKVLEAVRDFKNTDIKYFEFTTEEEELSFIIDEVKQAAEKISKDKSLAEDERENPYNNIAVLVRKRDQRQKVIEAFLKAGIPYASDGNEDIRGEKRVRQLLDVLELANVDMETNDKKSLALYKILTSDYVGADHSDILKIINRVNTLRLTLSLSESRKYNLFQVFQEEFEVNLDRCPGGKESGDLKISKELALKSPYALHKAAWAIARLLRDVRVRPVHDILLGYIDDVGLYKFVLDTYDKKEVLRVRDLRALVSFINVIKQASLSKPSLRIDDISSELELREVHGMPVRGELATLNQDGVKIYTAHSAKGLEFHTVFVPFCLEQKSWPVRSKPDVVPLPPDIYKSKERVDEKKKINLLKYYDELRLFYVVSTRAKSNLFFTAAPEEKVILTRFLNETDIAPVKYVFDSEEAFLKKYLEKIPKEDPVSSAKSVLCDIVKNIHLTPTKLNSYINCPRKFFYNYVLGLPGKKTQHLVFGNCAHKALEDVYKYFKENSKFPSFTFFSNSFRKELEFQGVSMEIKNMCLAKLEGLKDWFKREGKNPVMPFSLEEELSVNLPGGLTFKGKFDKIEIESDGTVKVVDYKTGKPDKHVKAVENCRDLSKHECDEYFRQLVSYKMIFDRNKKLKNMKVSSGRLQFLEPASSTVQKYGLVEGEYVDIDKDISEDMVLELEKVIVDSWKNIQELKFNKLPERDAKDRCERCEFDSICWEE